MATELPDPFDLLGVPARFDLPSADIERAYRSLAAAAHPDRGGAADGGVSIEAFNRARAVLLDAERRAEALLIRAGGARASDDRSLPDGFLQEIMGTRLEIESDAGDPAALERWEDWAEDERAAYSDRVASLFGPPGAALTDDARTEIRRELNAWRYIERLIEQLDPDYDPAQADFDRG